MSIVKAVRRAYEVKKERGWDKVYWAIDLHGVCLKSNYKSGDYKWINSFAYYGLRAISERPESRIILWSSVYDWEKPEIIKFFNQHGIRVDGFNENPLEYSTKVSDFTSKFYFSILLDDKAGFDPEVDWLKIESYLEMNK